MERTGSLIKNRHSDQTTIKEKMVRTTARPLHTHGKHLHFQYHSENKRIWVVKVALLFPINWLPPNKHFKKLAYNLLYIIIKVSLKNSVLSLKEKTTHYWFSYLQNNTTVVFLPSKQHNIGFPTFKLSARTKSFMNNLLNIVFDNY